MEYVNFITTKNITENKGWNIISLKQTNPLSFEINCFLTFSFSVGPAAAKSLQLRPDSVGPHRWQPTRLPCPWDSPGKNTGVGCHFFLQCMKVKSESEAAHLCPTLSDPMDCSLPGSSHGIFQVRVLEWVAIAFSPVGPRTPQGQRAHPNHYAVMSFAPSRMWVVYNH